jgi:hypothetical protein
MNAIDVAGEGVEFRMGGATVKMRRPSWCKIEAIRQSAVLAHLVEQLRVKAETAFPNDAAARYQFLRDEMRELPDGAKLQELADTLDTPTTPGPESGADRARFPTSLRLQMSVRVLAEAAGCTEARAEAMLHDADRDAVTAAYAFIYGSKKNSD